MSTLHNRTRTSQSIPRKLLRSGKVHLLPVYALMRTSDPSRFSLSSLPATRLGSVVTREALRRAGLAPDSVDEVIFG